MKFISFIAFALLLSFSASAATSTLHCSNAQGTVSWDKGVDDKIKLVYKGFAPGELVLDMDQVLIKESNEKTVSEVNRMNCGPYSYFARVFTMNVVITPADKSPHVFGSYFPKQEVRTTVICELQSSTRMNCSQE